MSNCPQRGSRFLSTTARRCPHLLGSPHAGHQQSRLAYGIPVHRQRCTRGSRSCLSQYRALREQFSNRTEPCSRSTAQGTDRVRFFGLNPSHKDPDTFLVLGFFLVRSPSLCVTHGHSVFNARCSRVAWVIGAIYGREDDYQARDCPVPRD